MQSPFPLLIVFLVLLQALPAGANEYVRVKDRHFELAGKRYAFMGANFWPAMNLASLGAGGDRPRLLRELDRLAALGVRNIRLIAATEGPDSEPWRIVPALQKKAGELDEPLWSGLDFLFSELRKRGLTAVVCLGNFWPWSGGMSQYLSWAGAGAIPYPPPAPNGSWSGYQSYAERFYSNTQAQAWAGAFLDKIVSRFRDEPSILAWELANEPRGGTNVEAFNQWIGAASRRIKALDHNHLVTTGSEGETPWPSPNGLDVVRNHRFESIDYVTIHIWAQNWGWYDPARPESLEPAIGRMREYFRAHLTKAKELGKPLVLEEFGLGRDSGSFLPQAATLSRDRYFRAVFEEVASAMAQGELIEGVAFWSWAGEARPRTPGGIWRAGDPFIGDPPHETQGWYSVYDEDRASAGLIREYAAKIGNLGS